MPSSLPAAQDSRMSQSNTVPPWVNTMVRGVLRSPLHPVLSGNIALFTFTGRKSGKEYNVAATYVRDGDVLTVFTDRAWAKNLRDGRPVTALVRGKRLDGTAELSTGPQIAGPLAQLLHQVPRDAKYHNVRRNPDGTLNQADIDRAAASESMVTVRLS
ncbi:nitroreductase/quinone reductase family protein [Mycobacteroides franklinii]|uniref:nitroreductase/quinone reductase family protein n=1 Tax=Mycobacteroides franklinii TaxID=948102 RepID=UPI000993EA54|nr:nitroreductase/quinone reductase family protein [Mycobacteroides franklinii]